MPEITMPEVKLPDLRVPDALREIDLSKVDLSGIEMPKQIADRLPKRSRPNPIMPIAALLAVGAAIAAAWWLVTSPITGPRVRNALNDLKARMNGEPMDLVRYDNDTNLGSLLADAPDAFASSNGMSDPDIGVPVGPGEMPEAARSN